MKKKALEELNRLSPQSYETAQKLPLIVVLDNIRSAHNVGAFFRTADAFAIQELVLTGFCQPPHKEIRKSAIGAQDTVDFRYFKENADAIAYLHQQKAKVLILEQTDSSKTLAQLSATDLQTTPVALVVGNEVGGVDDDFLAVADLALEIQQFGTKHSLNVSVAGGMAIWKIQSLLRTST